MLTNKKMKSKRVDAGLGRWRLQEVMLVVFLGGAIFGLYRSCEPTALFNGPVTFNVQIGQAQEGDIYPSQRPPEPPKQAAAETDQAPKPAPKPLRQNRSKSKTKPHPRSGVGCVEQRPDRGLADAQAHSVAAREDCFTDGRDRVHDVGEGGRDSANRSGRTPAPPYP